MCTTDVEIKLCKSFLPNFAGIVKFVAKRFGGNKFPMYFGVVQDWYCLIGRLVISHGHVTCVFVANPSYAGLFTYTLVLCVCAWYIFTHTLVIYVHALHVCSIH